MKSASLFCLLVLASVGVSVCAQDTKSDEAAIRALIANEQARPTDDAIFWSGAFKRPVVRPEKPEEFPGHEMSKRSNTKTTTEVHKIEVAASGDLAYEYSNGTLDFDQAANPPHISVQTACLRVWKKVDGQWKIAAMFVRPMDIPFETVTTPSAK